MRLLLDTHVLLWWDVDSRRLHADARALIGRADVVYVSAASAWEIAVKVALKRLRVDVPTAALIERNRFDELPISAAHADQIARLPLHHADPFDRMLVAQAQVESLTLMTHDPHLKPYQVAIAWV